MIATGSLKSSVLAVACKKWRLATDGIWDAGAMSSPPDGCRYRVLTGPDDAAFCHRVSEAIALGYRLTGDLR